MCCLQAFPVHLPTFVARLLAFKVAVDTSKLPAVGDLVKAFARLVLGGDRSAWDRALVMPHYAAAGMPLLSSLQVRKGGGWMCCVYRTVLKQQSDCFAFCIHKHALCLPPGCVFS